MVAKQRGKAKRKGGLSSEFAAPLFFEVVQTPRFSGLPPMGSGGPSPRGPWADGDFVPFAPKSLWIPV